MRWLFIVTLLVLWLVTSSTYNHCFQISLKVEPSDPGDPILKSCFPLEATHTFSRSKPFLTYHHVINIFWLIVSLKALSLYHYADPIRSDVFIYLSFLLVSGNFDLNKAQNRARHESGDFMLAAVWSYILRDIGKNYLISFHW